MTQVANVFRYTYLIIITHQRQQQGLSDKMDGLSGYSREFVVDTGRFKPRQLEVYGRGLCPAVGALRLI